MLPRDALKSAVAITLIATEPTKNGVKDQALCGVPLSRNAGRCQKPQITPRSNAAQIGASLRCSRGPRSVWAGPASMPYRRITLRSCPLRWSTMIG